MTKQNKSSLNGQPEPIPHLGGGAALLTSSLLNQVVITEPVPVLAADFKFPAMGNHFYSALRKFLALAREDVITSQTNTGPIKIVKILAKQVVQEKIPLSKIKIFFLFHIRNELIAKHYYQIFLKKCEEYTFEALLNEGLKFIPRSESFKRCMSDDKPYSLYQDDEQLRLIEEFIKKLNNITDLQSLNEFTKKLGEQESTWPSLMQFVELLAANKSCPKQYIFWLQAYYIQHFFEELSRLTHKVAKSTEAYANFESFIVEAKQKFINSYQADKQKQKFSAIRQLKESNSYISTLQPQATIPGTLSSSNILISDNKLLTTKKEQWITSKGTSQAAGNFSAYEAAIDAADANIAKANNLLIIAQVYLEKSILLKAQLCKLLERLSLAIDIFEQAFIQEEKPEVEVALKHTYAKRALVYERMAAKHPLYSAANWHNLERAKADYIKAEQTASLENHSDAKNNFIAIYQQANKVPELAKAVELYHHAVKAHPYFFEAHYQRLLAFYELKNLTQAHYLNAAFDPLVKAAAPIVKFLELLTQNQARSINAFVNKTIKIKIHNRRNKVLYAKVHLINNQYMLSCSSELKLIQLLKAAKLLISITKQTRPLVYSYTNKDFKNIITTILNEEKEQEANINQYNGFFADIRLINEEAFLKQDIRLLSTLPASRQILINTSFQNNAYRAANIQLAKAIASYQELLLLGQARLQVSPQNKDELAMSLIDIKRQLLELHLKRAANYQKQRYFSCEERELLAVLEKHAGKNNAYPAIYYRLAMLSKDKGNLDEFYHYLQLAKKRSFDKSNKKIFKKIRQQQRFYLNSKYHFPIQLNNLTLLKMESILTQLMTAEKSQYIREERVNELASCGVKFYPSAPTAYTGWNECLNSGLLASHGIDSGDELAAINDVNSETIATVNKILGCNLNFITIGQALKGLDKARAPILIFQKDNNYKIAIGLDKHKYANYLIVTHKIKIADDISRLCEQLLQATIKKSFNQEKPAAVSDLKQLFDLIIKSQTLKEFYEVVVGLTNESELSDFWLELADLETDIDLKNILTYVKEDFITAIDEVQKKEELKKAVLLKEKHAWIHKGQQLTALLNYTNELIKKLSDQTYVNPTCDNYKKLFVILAGNESAPQKIVNINKTLKIRLAAEAELNQYTTWLNILEQALAEPEINIKIGQIEITGGNIFLSTIQKIIEEKLASNSHIKQVAINGAHIFLDVSLTADCWHGIDFTVAGEIIKFDRNITIDVSGRKGKDGLPGESQPNAQRPGENGLDGRPGQNGEAGQNGGDITLIAQQTIHKKSKQLITLNASGGEGGIGGNGGNGGNGHAGADGISATVETLPWYCGGWYCEYGKSGSRGGHGGQGGNAGLGGYGGTAGQVSIKEKGSEVKDKFSIVQEDKSQIVSEDGKPGEGGKGGLGGLDGKDAIYVKYTFSSKKESGRNIQINKWYRFNFGTLNVPLEWSFNNKSEPELREEKQGKKGEQGLTAAKRLQIQRNKAAAKQRSSENQLKTNSNLNGQLTGKLEQEAVKNASEIESSEAKLQAQQQALAIIAAAKSMAATYNLNVTANKTSEWQIVQEFDSGKINSRLNPTVSQRCSFVLEKRVNPTLKQTMEEYKHSLLDKIESVLKAIENDLLERKRNFRQLFFDSYSGSPNFFNNSTNKNAMFEERTNYITTLNELKAKKQLLFTNQQFLASLDLGELIIKMQQKNLSYTQIENKWETFKTSLSQFETINLIDAITQFEQSSAEPTLDEEDARYLNELCIQDLKF